MMALSVAAISAFFGAYFWFAATATNRENKPLSKGFRWLHLITLPIICFSIGYYVGEFLSIPYPGSWVVAIIGMGPGLKFALGQLQTVPVNTIWGIQNTLWQQTAESALPLRLFATAGIVPLLPGEKIQALSKQGEKFRPVSFEVKKRDVKLSIEDVETKDGTPVDVTVVYGHELDHSRFQQIMEVNQDETRWWENTTTVIEGLLTSLVSDLIREEDASTVVNDKKDMSRKLREAAPLDEDEGFFPEGLLKGFRISSLFIADIDYTADILRAQQQKTKARAYADAARELIKLNPDFDKLTAEEKKDAIAGAVAFIGASDGKSTHIAIQRLGTSGGGTNIAEEMAIADRIPKKSSGGK